MHHEADLELRLLRAAHNDLDRLAVRHTSYDPALARLVKRVLASSRPPHVPLPLVPMRERTCRIPHGRSRTGRS